MGSRQDGFPVIQEWDLVEQLRQQLGSRSTPCRVWHGGWQRLLEGEKFLGYYVRREWLCPIAAWQRRIWRVRSSLSGIVPSCQWFWTIATIATIATSATSASSSTKPLRFHALRETAMPL